MTTTTDPPDVERCPFPGCPFVGPWAALLEHAATHPIPHPDDRPAWLATRRTFIGASEVPTVCGFNPWRGPLSVYASKVLASDDDGEEISTDAQRLGQLFEVPLLQDYADRHKVKLRRPTTMRHRLHPFMVATPDGEHASGDGTLVQIKMVGRRVARHWPGDTLPDYVRVQVNSELDVFDRKRAVVLALVGGTELQEHVVTFDPGIAADTREIVRRFWIECVVRRVLPTDYEGGDNTAALQALHPHALKPLADATAEERDLALEYADVRERIAALEDERDRLKSALCGRIGAREGIRWAGGPTLAAGYATWKAPKGSPRWKQIAEALAERFLTPTERDDVVAEFTDELAPRKFNVYTKDR